MTRKENLLVAALAAGETIEDAARAAGYNQAYARQKAGEAAVQAAVEAARTPAKPRRRKRKLDIGEELRGIILDPMCETSVKLMAIRVLIAWLRTQPAEPFKPPVIIDDVLEGQIYADTDGSIRLPEGHSADHTAAE